MGSMISSSWLIIAGSTDPPKHINAQKEADFDSDSKEDGNYLSQIVKNVQIVEQSIEFKDKCKLYNSYRNMKAKRKEALEQIKGLFESAVKNKDGSVGIYYTGHGANGNWCYSDGVITLDDVLNIANQYKEYYDQVFKSSNNFTAFGVTIWSQCCGSGSWCQQLAKYKGKFNFAVQVHASSWPGETSWGSKYGSYWTRYKFGKEMDCEKKVKPSWADLKQKMEIKGFDRYYEMVKQNNDPYKDHFITIKEKF